MLEKLQGIKERYDLLSGKLADPGVMADKDA